MHRLFSSFAGGSGLNKFFQAAFRDCTHAIDLHKSARYTPCAIGQEGFDADESSSVEQTNEQFYHAEPKSLVGSTSGVRHLRVSFRYHSFDLSAQMRLVSLRLEIRARNLATTSKSSPSAAICPIHTQVRNRRAARRLGCPPGTVRSSLWRLFEARWMAGSRLPMRMEATKLV